MGCTGKAPEHRARRRHCSMAGRQRHQSPRPPTNRRRRPTRNPPGPVETTPRPGYRACHQPARRCEGRQGHTQDAPHSVQATSGSARTNNPNDIPAGRLRPADSTPQSRRSEHEVHSIQWQHRQHTGQSALSNQGPGYAGPAGACPSFAAGRAAVWVSAPRDSEGRRLLN
jgi:hypothetical protein